MAAMRRPELCWRCQLVDTKPAPAVRHDPFMPAGDRIGICQPCAISRALHPNKPKAGV
jgi:hypothetical protein